MSRFSQYRFAAAALALMGLLAAPLAAAPPSHDEITIYQPGLLVRATLPDGPALPAIAAAEGISNILYLPSGRVLATSRVGEGPWRTLLSELLPNGSLQQIGLIEAPATVFQSDDASNLLLDSQGRVFVFMATLVYEGPTHQSFSQRVMEIDPATAATLSSKPITAVVGALATAPEGFWSAEGNGKLFKLDPDTATVSPTGLAIGGVENIYRLETDSAGRLWYIEQHNHCSPRCFDLGSFDPATGVATPAPFALYAQTPDLREIAIRRGCFESSTVRCLQGGRFRAEIDYEAYDGAAGSATVAPARSRDTGVFSFFDPDNWELMVKVLDGCAINEHFWVYSSASTDVEFTMTITDTETGAEKVYQNPLGQVARTVTDNQAFPCSP